MLTDILLVLAAIAILAGAVFEGIKGLLWFEPKPQAQKAVVMVLTIFMCLATGSDLFEVFGVILPWSSGAFFSGIILSMGAGKLHDIIGELRGNRSEQQPASQLHENITE